MKKEFYFLMILMFCINCKTGKMTGMSIAKLEDGLYFKQDLFVVINKERAYSEYFFEITNFFGLREAFTDTLIKQNDSLYSGNKFSIFIKKGILHFDAKFNPKDQFPVHLKKADEVVKKKWDKWHNRLLLNEVNMQYEDIKNTLINKAEKEGLIRAYKILKSNVSIDQESFLKKLIIFKKSYLSVKQKKII